jgi:hypothetical protein
MLPSACIFIFILWTFWPSQESFSIHLYFGCTLSSLFLIFSNLNPSWYHLPICSLVCLQFAFIMVSICRLLLLTASTHYISLQHATVLLSLLCLRPLPLDGTPTAVHLSVSVFTAPVLAGWPKSKSKLYYDRRLVGQSVLVSGTPFGSATNFSSFLELFLDSYWFNDVGRLLWREVGSVVLNWTY